MNRKSRFLGLNWFQRRRRVVDYQLRTSFFFAKLFVLRIGVRKVSIIAEVKEIYEKQVLSLQRSSKVIFNNRHCLLISE